MSPTIKIRREEWLAAAAGLMSEGVSPADWTLSGLCRRMSAIKGTTITKGSFYAHFPAGLGQLDHELINQWLQDNPAMVLSTTLPAVHDPADRLRMLWAQCIRTARRDGAMRRWAAREPAAAAAVAAVDRQLTEHASAALTDLGFGPAESAVLASVLVSAFAGAYHAAPEPPPADPAALETLLGVLASAAALHALAGDGEEVYIAPGAVAGGLVLIPLPKDKDLSAETLQRRLAQAQRLAAAAGGDSEPPAQRPARRAAAQRRTRA